MLGMRNGGARAGLLASASLLAITLGPAQAGVQDYPDTSTNSGGIILTDNSTQLQVLTGSATQSGVISDGGGGFGLEKIGGGALTLSGTNTYSGDTTLSAGPLVIGNNSALGTGNLIFSGGSLGASGNFSVGNTVITFADAAIDTNGHTLTLTGDVIDGGVSALTKNGLGTLILSGVNSINGVTTVNAGTLRAGASSAFSANSDHVIVGGATLDLGGFDQVIGSLAGGGTVTSNGANATLQVGNFGTNIQDTVFSGVIRDGSSGEIVSLQVETAGSLTLTGANTFTGGTLICDCSTLKIGNGGTTGSILGDITNDGTLIFNRSNGYTFAGNILQGFGSPGLVIQNGSGVLTLTGTNTYGGGTFINAGQLLAGSDFALGGGDVTISNGATLGIADLVTVSNNIIADANAKLFVGSGFSGEISGVISDGAGANGITKTGGGTLTLSGANTYTGATAVSAGTLELTVGTASVGVSDYSVASGATIALNGFDFFDFNTLSGAGNVTFQNGAALDLGFFGPGGTTSFSGTLTGDGDLIVSGATVLTLTGNVTHSLNNVTLCNCSTGSLTLHAGTMNVLDVTEVLSGTLTVENGAQWNTDQLYVSTAMVVDAAHVTVTTFTGIGDPFTSPSSLTIRNGAVVQSQGLGAGVDGDVSNNPATVLITGSGSQWNVSGGELEIGAFANGVVTVAAGGALSATDGLHIYSGGILNIGSGGVAGSVSAPLYFTNDGQIAANFTGTVTLADAIDGSGTLSKSGSGTLILTGSDTYSGGTTIGAGTLQVGNGGTAGLISGDITDNSALVFNRSDASAYGGVISGSGSLTKQGGGTLTLVQNSLYSGITTINGGTLALSSNGAIAGSSSVVDNANFDISAVTAASTTIKSLSGATSGTVALGSKKLVISTGSGIFAGTFTGTGSVELSGGATTLTGANSVAFTVDSGATLQVGNSGTSGSISSNIVDNGTLAFARTDNITYGGVISGGGGLTQNGSGTLFLTGASTYTGATFVNAGVLSVNGSIASTVTLAGGTLKGNGTVGGVNVGSGTIAPGNSIGTLNTGSINFAAGSTYQVEVNAAGQADLINASGAANLNGTVQVVPAAGSYVSVTTYRILNAGSISGTFASVISTDAGFTPSLIYGASTVDLRLMRNNFGTAYGVTPNQIAAGNAVSAGGSSALYTALSNAYAPATITSTLDSVSGEIHASLRSAMIEDSRMIRDAVLGRLAGAAGSGVWVQGFAEDGALDSDGNAAQTHHSQDGFIAGFDLPLSDGFRAGLAGAYTEHRVTQAARASRASGNNGAIIGYAGWQGGAWRVDLGGDYGWGSDAVARSVAALAETESGNQDSQSSQVFARASYDLGLPSLHIAPYFGLAHVSATTGAFAESGGLAALSGAANSDSQTFTTLGARYAMSELDMAAMPLILYADLGWSHALSGRTPGQLVSFSTGQSFTVLGAPIGANAATVQLGADLVFAPDATFSLGYDGSYSDRGASHALRGGLEWRF